MFQRNNTLERASNTLTRFLKIWAALSLFLVPALAWPYFFLRANLPSDVRIAIPVLSVFFALSLLFGFIARSRFESSLETSSQGGKKRPSIWLSPQAMKLTLLLLIQIAAWCATGALWLNLRLLFVNSLRSLPAWTWIFLPPALTLLLLLVVEEGGSLLHYLQDGEQISARRIFALAFSFLSAMLVGSGIAAAAMYYFRNRVSLFDKANLNIALLVFLPTLIFDANLLFSVFGAIQVERISSRLGFSVFRGSQNDKKADAASGIREREIVLARASRSSFLYTLALFVFSLAILRPGYGVNDDIQMIAMASGYWGGAPIPFLVFSNAALGLLLNFLYSLHTFINWEIWLFIIVHFFSIWALVFLILSSESMRPAMKTIGILIVMSSEIHFLLYITFTTVAVVASLAGGCLLLTASRLDLPFKPSLVVWGSVLILVAGLIRIESAALVLLPMIPFLIYGYRSFNIKRLALTLGLSGCLLLGFYAFDNAYIGSFPAWDAYKTYTLTRSMIYDTPRLMNIDGAIKDIGWSPNDLNMLERWFLLDPNVYSIEKLRYLARHVSDRQSSIHNLILSLPDRLTGHRTLPYIMMIVSLWLAMTLYSPSLKKSLAPSMTATLLIVFIIVLLQWTQKAPDRILISLFTTAIVFSFWSWHWSGVKRDEESSGPALSGVLFRIGFQSLLISMLAVAFMVLQQSVLTTRANIKKQFVYQEILSSIDNLQAHGRIERKALIVSLVYGIPWEWSNPLYLNFPKVQYLTTNWATFSPVYQETLKEFQINSMPSGLYQRRNVYLMADASTLRGIIQFIKEHEGVNVRAQTIYAIPSQYSAGTLYEGAALFKLQQRP